MGKGEWGAPMFSVGRVLNPEGEGPVPVGSMCYGCFGCLSSLQPLCLSVSRGKGHPQNLEICFWVCTPLCVYSLALAPSRRTPVDSRPETSNPQPQGAEALSPLPR